jgi:hypothetical protein
MINLKIPRAAYAAGWNVFRSGQREGIVTDAVIDAAMPLAFAAELRELVHELEAIKAEMRDVDGRTLRSSGLGEGISFIRNRIAELDPEGLTA